MRFVWIVILSFFCTGCSTTASSNSGPCNMDEQRRIAVLLHDHWADWTPASLVKRFPHFTSEKSPTVFTFGEKRNNTLCACSVSVIFTPSPTDERDTRLGYVSFMDASVKFEDAVASSAMIVQALRAQQIAEALRNSTARDLPLNLTESTYKSADREAVDIVLTISNMKSCILWRVVESREISPR